MGEHMRLSLDILSVDRASDDPMHRQIYAALRRFILDGQIAAHTLLPSTRSLAEDLKVGRNTVIAAYDQLLAEGFIEARAGSLFTASIASRSATATTSGRDGSGVAWSSHARACASSGSAEDAGGDAEPAA